MILRIKRIIMFIVFLSILVLAGCRISTDTSVVPEVVENSFSELVEKLTVINSDYVGLYERTTEVHLWSGGSGASDYTDISKILIEVKNRKVMTYTLGFSRPNGSPSANEYVEYYNESSGELCKIVKNRKFRDCPDPYDSSSCDFEKLCPDPNFCNLVMVDEKTCTKYPPIDYDFIIKKEILDYLGKNSIKTVEKKENKNLGICYSIFHKNLEQKFCFDKNNMLTHAIWGEKLNTKYTSRTVINTLNKKN